MTPAIDPYRRYQRRMALQVGACGILVLLAGVWAWRTPTPTDPTLSIQPPTAAGAPAATSTIDLAAWDVALWRPFVDEAPPAATPSAPMALKLFSILQQDDGLTAAIAAGEKAELVYVKAGDTCHGFTVLRVEANGVVLRINGREQRLGFGP